MTNHNLPLNHLGRPCPLQNEKYENFEYYFNWRKKKYPNP